MLAGLLRLRHGSGGTFELWGVLWKQVGHWRFLLAWMRLAYFFFDILEGVIWLAIATFAELPQAVSLFIIIVPESIRFLLIAVLHCSCSCF
jgi:hypothetical protein